MKLALFKNKHFTKNFIKLMTWGQGEFELQLLSGDLSMLVASLGSTSNEFYKDLRVVSASPELVIKGSFKKIVNQSPVFIFEEKLGGFRLKVEFSKYFKFLIRLTILFSLFLIVQSTIGVTRTGGSGLPYIILQILGMQLFGTFIYFDIMSRSLKHIKMKLFEDFKIVFDVTG